DELMSKVKMLVLIAPRASPDNSSPQPFLPPQPRIVSPDPYVLPTQYEPEAPETVSCPAFIPESELSEEEKNQRKAQEQADYEELVNPELMTTWNYLLDLLPEN
ncbi:16121_t:CDS:2, partial [Funneliformis geosporum]